VTATPDTALEDIARLMLEHRIGCVVIVSAEDPGRVAGIVTETDFDIREAGIPFSAFRAPKLFGNWISSEAELAEAYEQVRRRRVRDIMQSPVITVSPDDEVWRAARLMIEHDIKRLPVVEGGRLVGIVTRHDLLKRCVAESEGP
jgi:CBS domain-containing protein